MTARIVNIEGKELVILSRAEFDDLMEKAGVMPSLPKAAKDGSVPAIEYCADGYCSRGDSPANCSGNDTAGTRPTRGRQTGNNQPA